MKLVRALMSAVVAASCAVSIVSVSAAGVPKPNPALQTYKAIPCFGYPKYKYVDAPAVTYVYALQRDCSYKYVYAKSKIK